MHCPTCAAEIQGTPKFCPACGSKLEHVPMSDTLAQPLTDPFLGKVVGGKYKILKLLGEGGMGAVYVGEQTIAGTSRKVAIKTLHAHLSKDPKIQARFERECAMVAGLQHPNTIALYDFGTTDDGTLYMVMEFVQGRSLASILEEKHGLEPPRVVHIVQQICDALGEAHGLGIIHRDLKPDNVVLTERAKDWVKLLDFGIAKRSDEGAEKKDEKLTQQGTVLGTPPYMSPEQFSGRALDPRSDLYSVATMTYEMLAGRLPFTATTPWEWAHQHLTVPPAPLTTTFTGEPIQPAMVAAVMRALEKDPQSRFASVKDFYEAFSSGVTQISSSPVTPALSSSQKGRTEIGTPLDVPAAGAYGTPPAGYGAGYGTVPGSPVSPGGPPGGPGYGSSPSGGGYALPPTSPSPGAYGTPPAPAQPQYTPAAGNVAFPTPPAGSHQAAKKGGKGGVVSALVVLLVLFGGLVGYGAMHRTGSRGGGSGGGGGIPTADSVDAGEAPPVVETAEVPEASDTPVTLDTNIAPLTNGKPPPTPGHHDAGARPGPGHQPPRPPPPPPPPPGPGPVPGPAPVPHPPAIPQIPQVSAEQACNVVMQWKNSGWDRDPSRRAAYAGLIRQCNAFRQSQQNE